MNITKQYNTASQDWPCRNCGKDLMYPLSHECERHAVRKHQAAAEATRADRRILVPLTTGEIDMVRRALRVWAHCEQEAMQTAACARDPVHAADVARQVRPRISAAHVLLDRLLQDPTLVQS